MSVPSLQLAAALTSLAASQDAQQAEAIRLRLALAEARAALEGMGKGIETYLTDLRILQVDIAQLGAECRRLEELMDHTDGTKDR